MRKFFIVLIVMMTSIGYAQDSGLKGKSVLIYNFTGEGYVHENIAASAEALEEICNDLGIKTTQADHPEVFEKKDLQNYDAIVFSNTNNEAFLTRDQRAAFKAYILSGKGFMGIHSANATAQEWPWYVQMIGGKFVRHPKLQKFDIHVIDPTHISTSHLPEVWKWEDECYYSNHLNPAINILLAGDLNTVTDDQKDEYPGEVFGNYIPLAWNHVFEGTRVFYTALGHKKEYYDEPAFRDHLKGGVVWILE